MKKFKTIVIIAIMPILLNGCSSYYPQVVDIPLIKEKGDLRVDAGTSYIPSIHGTISYGLTNVVAIQAYGNLDVFGRFHLQGAAGLFKGFENKTVMEAYSGYGYGNSFASSLLESHEDYHLAFVQFNLGKTDQGKAHIDYGLGIKTGYLYSKVIDGSDLKTIVQDDGLVLEPSVFFRIGGERIKFAAKANYLWTNNTAIDEYSTHFYHFILSMGINFNF